MKKKKDLDTILQEVLETAPSIEGYTIGQLSEVINSSWTIRGWHLERLEARSIAEPFDPQRYKIYRRGKKAKRK